MRVHQVRVGAVFNCAERGARPTDPRALAAWHTWAMRTIEREREALRAETARYDARAAEFAYYDAIERGFTP